MPLPKRSTVSLGCLPTADVSQITCTAAASQTVSHSPILCPWVTKWLHSGCSSSSLSRNFKELRCHLCCFRAPEMAWCHFNFRMAHGWCWQCSLRRWHQFVLQDARPHWRSSVWVRVWCLVGTPAIQDVTAILNWCQKVTKLFNYVLYRWPNLLSGFGDSRQVPE